jgi:peptidoglycan/xylan/chitin deacetylase (PgdA/CDA1 family)
MKHLNTVSQLSKLALSRKKAPGSLTALTFHRILTKPDAMHPEYPIAKDFHNQIRWLNRVLKVVSLQEGIDRVIRNREPVHLSCITFDDGYMDNFEIALPILLKEKMKASFFIATACMEEKSLFNDVLIEAFRKTKHQFVTIPTLGSESQNLGSQINRSRLANRCIEILKYQSPNIRDSVTLDIAKQLGEVQLTPKMMSANHVLQLREQGMTIGSHTHQHVVAASVALDEFKADIIRSKEILSDLLGTQAFPFAFPNGKSGLDQNEDHSRVVKEAGFSCAFSSDLGNIQSKDDLFALRRFSPWACEAIPYGAQLIFNSRFDAFSHIPSESNA